MGAGADSVALETSAAATDAAPRPRNFHSYDECDDKA